MEQIKRGPDLWVRPDWVNLQLPVPMEYDVFDEKIVFLTLKLPRFHMSFLSEMHSFRVREVQALINTCI